MNYIGMQNIGLGAVFTFIDNSAIGIRNAQANFTRFTSTISGDKGASAAIGGFQSTIGRMGGILPPGIQNIASLGGQFGSLAATLGPVAIAVGAGVFAVAEMIKTMTEATKVAKEFEFGIAKIRTLLPADVTPVMNTSSFLLGLSRMESETDKAMSRIAAMVSSNSMTFGKRQGDMLKATYDALSSGIETSDIGGFMNVVGKMAVGGDVDMKVAVGALASIKNAYNYTMTDMTKVSDMMFNAVNRGVFEMKDLTSALGQVTGISSGLGIGLDEVLAMTSTLSLTGRTASESITGIKQAMMTVMAKTPIFVKGAEEFGIKYDKATVASMGFSKWLAYANTKLKAGGADMSALFRDVEALNAVLPLTGNKMKLNAEILKSMGASAGLTSRAFGIMQETLQFKEDRLAAVRENFLKNIGTMFLPITKAWVDFQIWMYSGLNHLVGAWNTSFFKPISEAFSPIFAIVGKVLGVIFSGLGSIVTIGMRFNGFIVQTFLTPLRLIGNVLLTAFNAIGGFISSIGTRLEPIVNIFQFIGSSLFNLVSAPFQGVVTTLGNVLSWIGEKMNGVFDWMSNKVGTFVQFFVDMFFKIPTFIAQVFVNVAMTVSNSLYGILKFLLSVVRAPIELLEKMGTFEKGTHSRLETGLSDSRDARSTVINDTGQQIYEMISKAIQDGMRKRDEEKNPKDAKAPEESVIDLLAKQNNLIADGNEERKKQGKKREDRQQNDYDTLIRNFVPISVR